MLGSPCQVEPDVGVRARQGGRLPRPRVADVEEVEDDVGERSSERDQVRGIWTREAGRPRVTWKTDRR